jgi:tetratricopeptide (TPR) repeat protein
MNLVKKIAISLFVSSMFLQSAFAGVDEDVFQLKKTWEQLKYKTLLSEQEKGFESLLAQSEKVTAQYPDKAEPLVWQGIIEGTFAGVRNGIRGQLAALSLVKDAKQHFEQAIKIDPNGSDGSAFTSLGSLYYQVPPWPIAYGDNDKAKDMLLKGLEINPDGIDANYFYGEFLFKRGQLNKATEVLKKGLLASPREGREVADEGRKKEINDLLKKIVDKK